MQMSRDSHPADYSKRISMHSGLSEFSFEQHEDIQREASSTGPAATIHLSTDRLQTSMKASGKIEMMAKRNGELEKKVAEQNGMITSLQSYITMLEEQLRASAQEVPQFVETTTIPKALNVNSLTVDIKKAMLVDELQLPVRSADRLRTSPLKRPVSTRSILSPNSHVPLPSLEVMPTSNSLQLDAATVRPLTDISTDAGSMDLNTNFEDELTTPVHRKPNIDWDATIEALKTSTENLYELKDMTRPEQKSLTPYSGRINAQSPMKSTVSSNMGVSPAQSGLGSSQTSFAIVQSGRIETPKSMTPVSPFKVSRGLQQPTSPVSSTAPDKSNLYDPYIGGLFQHEQIYQEHSVQGGIYNDAFTPRTPQTSTFDDNDTEQSSPKFKFPTDVALFVDPANLNTVRPEIVSTVLGNPSKKSDDPVIVIAAIDRQTNKEMWRFKKTLSQLTQLDIAIRPLINSFSLPPVPEKALFLLNLPSKVDARRLRTRDYFATLFTIPNIPMQAAYAIARFMSLDVVNLLDEFNPEALKEGWLLRRMKGLGNNWKARYCFIEGSSLQVTDTPGGQLIESIKLASTQIGKQPDGKPNDDKSAYRHAFAVMEPKKTLKSGTRHIFCAETDAERDDWVNVLVRILADDTAQSIYTGDTETIISFPASTAVSPAKSLLAVETDEEKEAKRNKKRSFFPFTKKLLSEADRLGDSSAESNIQNALEEMDLGGLQSENVFQNELVNVVKLSEHVLYGVEIPSVMFRCIQFLLDKSAIYEEGLFRLSGSSLLIRQLREQFDRLKDVDFKQMDPIPDINTVAGLLKLWLRELPSNILTKAMYPQFKDASHMDPVPASLEVARLVKGLPQANYSVLYALFRFLNEVIKNKDLNKMNLRNLCIVFSPTLNVAGEMLVPFLVDFQCVFEGGEPVSDSERDVLDLNIPMF